MTTADALKAWEAEPTSAELAEAMWRAALCAAALEEGVPCATCNQHGQYGTIRHWWHASPETGCQCDGRARDPAAVVAFWLGFEFGRNASCASAGFPHRAHIPGAMALA